MDLYHKRWPTQGVRLKNKHEEREIDIVIGGRPAEPLGEKRGPMMNIFRGGRSGTAQVKNDAKRQGMTLLKVADLGSALGKYAKKKEYYYRWPTRKSPSGGKRANSDHKVSNSGSPREHTGNIYLARGDFLTLSRNLRSRTRRGRPNADAEDSNCSIDTTYESSKTSAFFTIHALVCTLRF